MIKANIESVKSRIARACESAGRGPNDVVLLAATKDVPLDLVEQAIQAGITDIGENRVQEASEKIPALREKHPGVKFHMIGHLQTNKARRAAELFDIIQSVDSPRLADELDKRAGELQKKLEVFMEANVSGEAQKFGIDPNAALDLARHIAGLKNLTLTGLMTVPPFFDDPERARPYFRRLSALRDEFNSSGENGVLISRLSMGMSGDFEAAIAEGSGMVRIGYGIFGVSHKI